MPDNPIATRPPSSSEQFLQDKFTESIVAQSEQMDKLGQQLITLELAIPGLYATVLKLVSGEDATLIPGPALIGAFVFWFVALGLTLASLIPRAWQVNRNIIQRDAGVKEAELSIEEFFYKSAQYKRRLLIAASVCFFGGIVGAALTIF